MDTSLEDRIRARAYEIWEIEGWPSGRDQEHWDRALREIQSGERAESADIAPPGDTADGVASGLQPRGTTPSGGPGAGPGGIGTGGASTAGTPSGSVRKRSPS
ncbi:DUF2934 domain-containing protein [Inquilinus sp. NPDC058860]|uniref:DUF2934 domain-containing protein n=1 Tax=Inquilinus sp. NPDC058860 TaxID=3346652 RepID=UPI0036814D72